MTNYAAPGFCVVARPAVFLTICQKLREAAQTGNCARLGKFQPEKADFVDFGVIHASIKPLFLLDKPILCSAYLRPKM